MAKRRAENQIASLTSDHKNSGIDPIHLVERGHAAYRWKALNEIYNFALDFISIRGLLAKLWGPKSRESHLARFRDS
jgi:hypothetical protein